MGKNTPLVSIIVPFFNTGKIIESTLSSILKQTYFNLEIILINDGSTDDTLHYVESLQLQDNRIILVNQSNTGQNGARQKGFLCAKGEYICFVDSDDLLDKEFISSMVEIAEKEGSDMVVSNIRNIYKNREPVIADWFEKKDVQTKQQICLAFLTKIGNGSLCAKLYKRDKFSFSNIWVGHRIRANEDYLVYFQNVLKNFESISYSSYIGYNYVHREGTMSGCRNIQYVYDTLRVSYFLYCLAFSYFPNDLKIHKALSFYLYKRIYFSMMRNMKIYHYKKELRTLYAIANLHREEYANLSPKEKIYIFLSQSNWLLINGCLFLKWIKHYIK